MKEGSKYYPLFSHLYHSGREELTLTVSEIESMIGSPLPASARGQRAWWSNRTTGAVQSAAWLRAGYEAAEVDLAGGRVTFRKIRHTYHVQRIGDDVVWDGELVKVVRQHAGLSQAEMAEELGVRQQTISEWETGSYTPKRAMSKLLTIFAERAGFKFGE
jgi:DNA-binding XRE family transcriptional regulator